MKKCKNDKMKNDKIENRKMKLNKNIKIYDLNYKNV
jgi:hypothetical protein